MPSPVVAFPCGSRSIRSVCLSARESPAARLTAVVVFPTPPFWLTTAMVRASRSSVFHVEHSVACSTWNITSLSGVISSRLMTKQEGPADPQCRKGDGLPAGCDPSAGWHCRLVSWRTRGDEEPARLQVLHRGGQQVEPHQSRSRHIKGFAQTWTMANQILSPPFEDLDAGKREIPLQRRQE